MRCSGGRSAFGVDLLWRRSSLRPILLHPHRYGLTLSGGPGGAPSPPDSLSPGPVWCRRCAAIQYRIQRLTFPFELRQPYRRPEPREVEQLVPT
jgi:hypothetical protein